MSVLDKAHHLNQEILGSSRMKGKDNSKSNN
jgi:hypothetical protein